MAGKAWTGSHCTALHLPSEMLEHEGPERLLLHGHDPQDATHKKGYAHLLILCLSGTGINNHMRTGDHP